MKNYLFLCVFFLIFSCTNNKSVYWCGDHPCINNKEKEAYFKKTMIVEVRELKKESNKDISEFEKLLKQAQVDEKKRIMSEKGLAKQVRLEEKREKNNIWKDEKKLPKKEVSKTKNKETAINIDMASTNISSAKFKELAERIILKNKFRPFPNINDISN